MALFMMVVSPIFFFLVLLFYCSYIWGVCFFLVL